VEDADGRSVVAFKELEELSGKGPLQASPDVTAALALGLAAGGIGAGLGIVAEPGHYHGVERPVELPSPDCLQSLPKHGSRLVGSVRCEWCTGTAGRAVWG
jgi:hypothetical protein